MNLPEFKSLPPWQTQPDHGEEEGARLYRHGDLVVREFLSKEASNVHPAVRDAKVELVQNELVCSLNDQLPEGWSLVQRPTEEPSRYCGVVPEYHTVYYGSYSFINGKPTSAPFFSHWTETATIAHEIGHAHLIANADEEYLDWYDHLVDLRNDGALPTFDKKTLDSYVRTVIREERKVCAFELRSVLKLKRNGIDLAAGGSLRELRTIGQKSLRTYTVDEDDKEVIDLHGRPIRQH